MSRVKLECRALLAISEFGRRPRKRNHGIMCRLTDGHLALVDAMAAKYGCTRTALGEILLDAAILDAAEEFGIPIPEEVIAVEAGIMQAAFAVLSEVRRLSTEEPL